MTFFHKLIIVLYLLNLKFFVLNSLSIYSLSFMTSFKKGFHNSRVNVQNGCHLKDIVNMQSS